jgi:hypothetical protein
MLILNLSYKNMAILSRYKSDFPSRWSYRASSIGGVIFFAGHCDLTVLWRYQRAAGLNGCLWLNARCSEQPWRSGNLLAGLGVVRVV